MGLRSGLLAGQSSMKSTFFVLRKLTVSLAGDIIMLKNGDVGVVMEQRNDVMSENVIAVLLSI